MLDRNTRLIIRRINNNNNHVRNSQQYSDFSYRELVQHRVSKLPRYGKFPFNIRLCKKSPQPKSINSPPRKRKINVRYMDGRDLRRYMARTNVHLVGARWPDNRTTEPPVEEILMEMTQPLPDVIEPHIDYSPLPSQRPFNIDDIRTWLYYHQ